MTCTIGANPIAMSALTYTSISASRAAQSTATIRTTPPTVSTVSSIFRRNSRSDSTEISALQILCREASYQVVDLGQFRKRGEEDNPQKSFVGGKAEAGAVDAQHASRVEQRLHVVFVRPAGRQRDARHHVERRVRCDDRHA